MISPSLQMETENEDTSDTDDSDADDESVNIYDEALNCEDHSYKDDAINSIKWAEQKRQATYFPFMQTWVQRRDVNFLHWWPIHSPRSATLGSVKLTSW